jgi:hypothetical protein
LTQREVLKGLAIEGSTAVYTKGFISKYKLGTPAYVQAALKVLLKKGILDREEKLYSVVDVFFAEWVRRRGE